MNNLINNSTLWFQILMILLLLLTMPVSPESLAQTNDANSNKVDFVNIAYLIGLSGLISAVVSAMINYFNNYRRSKSERQRKAVAESRFVFDFYFYLERMIHNASFSEGIEPVEKIDYTVRDIDLILKDRFYLVKHTVFSKWLGIRSDWEENYEKNRQQLVDNVIDLRNLLADIYNNELHQEYKKRVNTPLERIEPKSR